MTENVVGISADSGSGALFTIKTVTSVVGDCDVTQRKGKTLCIYDLKLVFSVEVSDDAESTRLVLVTIPEFIHDQDDDEYVFEIEQDARRSDLRTHLIPLLKSKLQSFQEDLIEAHDQDVKHTTS